MERLHKKSPRDPDGALGAVEGDAVAARADASQRYYEKLRMHASSMEVGEANIKPRDSPYHDVDLASRLTFPRLAPGRLDAVRCNPDLPA
jgi:hypothetical protein